MSAFEALLGPQLVDAKGTKFKTVDKLQKTYVGIYCSAMWCAPCRKFTPLLMELYKKLRSLGKNFEVVFSSWDSDKDGFNEYFGKMPWLAIPYENASFRDNIKTKYQVTGIPDLIMLGPNGELININAIDSIKKDEDGVNYPWSDKLTIDVLSRELIKDVSGTKIDGSTLKGHKFGVYFSASWCPSCKIFTPKLIENYIKIKSENKDFELVYVSRDKTKEEFGEYYGKMPWLALPFGEDTTRDLLLAINGVRFIPTLILFNEKGERVRSDGRDAMEANPNGYPWEPLPLLYMHKSPEDINTNPCIILFSPESNHRAIFERIITENKKDGVSFILCNIEDGVSEQIRGLTHQTKIPLLMTIDIPQDGAYYLHGGELTYEGMTDFVKKYYAGSIERQQMG